MLLGQGLENAGQSAIAVTESTGTVETRVLFTAADLATAGTGPKPTATGHKEPAVNSTNDFEPVDFSAVALGDRVRFATADNGYGGTGGTAWRTGTVTKVTAKVIAVVCDDWMKSTAILRRATWTDRAVSRAATVTD
jgi:hypothetical protein